MKIGTLKNDDAGDFAGRITTLDLDLEIVITGNDDRQGEDSPNWIVSARTARGLVQLGGGWNKKANGREYVSLSLDDPSFDRPLSCAVFPAKRQGEHDVIWNRPQKQAA